MSSQNGFHRGSMLGALGVGCHCVPKDIAGGSPQDFGHSLLREEDRFPIKFR